MEVVYVDNLNDIIFQYRYIICHLKIALLYCNAITFHINEYDISVRITQYNTLHLNLTITQSNLFL